MKEVHKRGRKEGDDGRREDERGITAGEGGMRETREAKVVSNEGGGGRMEVGRTVRQMY